MDLRLGRAAGQRLRDGSWRMPGSGPTLALLADPRSASVIGVQNSGLVQEQTPIRQADEVADREEMNVKVIDSNFLRTRATYEFLKQSPRNAIVICEHVFLEMHKGNPRISVPKSTEFVDPFWDRTWILRRDKFVADSREFPVKQLSLVNIPATTVFREYCGLVYNRQYGILPDEHHLSEFRDFSISKLRDYESWMPALVHMFKQNDNYFNKHDLLEVRNDGEYSSELQDKIVSSSYDLMRYNTDHIFNAVRPVDAIEGFRFRLALCLYIYGLRWRAYGAQERIPPKKLRNDIADCHIAAYGTLFEGVLSRDKGLIKTYERAVRLIKYARETRLKQHPTPLQSTEPNKQHYTGRLQPHYAETYLIPRCFLCEWMKLRSDYLLPSSPPPHWVSPRRAKSMSS